MSSISHLPHALVLEPPGRAVPERQHVPVLLRGVAGLPAETARPQHGERQQTRVESHLE